MQQVASWFPYVLAVQSKIHNTYCMIPQDGEVDSSDAGDTKGMDMRYLSHDREASPARGVQLHVTVEKTVECHDVPGTSPEDLPTLDSKYDAEV